MTVASAWRSAAQALLALALSSAHAQSTEARLPTAVVTPSRIVQSIDDALPSTTVITRAEIDRWQLSDLVGTLSRETGVQFARSGGPGSASSLFVRGANSSQVLVLVDGVPLNAAVGGAASLGGIALDTVDRIEISRGNLSSLYGSAAIGGVVQIFTRGGAAPRARACGRRRAGTQLQRRRQRIGRPRRAAHWRVDRHAAQRPVLRDRRRAALIPGPFAPGANPDLDAQPRTPPARSARRTGPPGGTVFAAQRVVQHQPTDFDSTADGPAADARGAVEHQRMERARAQPADVHVGVAIAAGRDAGFAAATSQSDPWSFNNGEFESTQPAGELEQRSRRSRSA